LDRQLGGGVPKAALMSIRFRNWTDALAEFGRSHVDAKEQRIAALRPASWINLRARAARRTHIEESLAASAMTRRVRIDLEEESRAGCQPQSTQWGPSYWAAAGCGGGPLR